MPLKLPFETTGSVKGQASIYIDKPIQVVFNFVGDQFFENYPKWAAEVIEFVPLDGEKVFVGARARQVRQDSEGPVESVFQIIDFRSLEKLSLCGLNEPYQHNYVMVDGGSNGSTTLTFQFELLELEVFMRPFEKLIRYAIEEGAENTVQNIKHLIDNN
jgi:hypothetical protein